VGVKYMPTLPYCDVSEEFPFLVTKLPPYYDRERNQYRRYEMNTQNIPGFTAEASLYKTREHLHAAIEGIQTNQAVYPAQIVSDRAYLFYCWRYRCVPEIDIYGHVRWNCGFVYIC
jgi:hypothetical protein